MCWSDSSARRFAYRCTSTMMMDMERVSDESEPENMCVKICERMAVDCRLDTSMDLAAGGHLTTTSTSARASFMCTSLMCSNSGDSLATRFSTSASLASQSVSAS